VPRARTDQAQARHAKKPLCRRALCWVLRRLRAGQCGWCEIQKPLTGRAKCVMRPGQGQKSQSLEWEETKREILDSAFRQNFDEIWPSI
jgi:hypothetical protein